MFFGSYVVIVKIKQFLVSESSGYISSNFYLEILKMIQIHVHI